MYMYVYTHLYVYIYIYIYIHMFHYSRLQVPLRPYIHMFHYCRLRVLFMLYALMSTGEWLFHRRGLQTYNGYTYLYTVFLFI